MLNLSVLYPLFVLLACLSAILLVWSHRNLFVRILAVVILIIIFVFGHMALSKLLGNPKHLSETGLSSRKNSETSLVVAASIEENVAVYLWLRHGTIPQPTYYQMDWNEKTASMLKNALDESIKNNTDVVMKHNFEQSIDSEDDPLFYTLPWEKLPDKPPPEFTDYQSPLK